MSESSTTNALEIEKRAFKAKLPEMLVEHAGEFAVFKGGEAVGFFAEPGEAYAFAIEEYGPDGLFLIEEVADGRKEIASLSWELGVTHVQ